MNAVACPGFKHPLLAPFFSSRLLVRKVGHVRGYPVSGKFTQLVRGRKKRRSPPPPPPPSLSDFFFFYYFFFLFFFSSSSPQGSRSGNNYCKTRPLMKFCMHGSNARDIDDTCGRKRKSETFKRFCNRLVVPSRGGAT